MSAVTGAIDVVAVLSTPCVVQPPTINAARIAAIRMEEILPIVPVPPRPFPGSFVEHRNRKVVAGFRNIPVLKYQQGYISS